MKKIIYFLLAISIIAELFPVAASAQNNNTEFYVSVTGDDNNDGTKDRPFATVERAKEEVRKVNRNMSGDITVYLREGVYELENTLRFSAEDSGTNGYYVRYKAYNNENVKISGGDKITGWSKHNDKIWKASYGDGDYVRQLYVNGNRARRAQTENLEHISDFYNDESDDTYNVDGLVVDSDRFASYKNKEDIQLHLGRGWFSLLFNVNDIIAKDGKSIFTLLQPDLNSAVTNVNHPLRADLAVTVENAFEELDAEGEFYYNRSEKNIYYMPRKGEDMITADAWSARLEILMEIKGEKSINKVKNIEFNGIDFAHATWQRPSELGLKNGQAQTFTVNEEDKKTDVPNGFVPACIQLQWAEKISFINNTVKDMGAVGIGLYQGVSYCNFEGNIFADIADGAITVGLPNQTYEDAVYEGYNLAADKPTTASGETNLYPSSNIVDVNNKTLWTQADSVYPAWVQVDLLDEYRIDRVEIVGRQDMDQPTTRANFEIQASNDPDFNDFVVLANQGAIPFEHRGTCVLYCDNENEYRYVRIKKTDGQYFLVTEMRVINEDMEYSPVRESCKFNRIRNNYITRVGYVNWGAPAIQGYYVENLDITHNEIYNVAYSGICIGWGWTTFPDSTVCRDNKVMYNRVHRNNLINFDGGSFYSLGQQPNTVVRGNYMSDQPNYIATLYSDNGTKYQTVMENVLENVNQAYFLNSGTGYLTYKNNYSPHSGGIISDDHTNAEPTIRYIPGNPPIEALKIMKNAGIEKKWEQIKKKAGEDMWPVTIEHTFADIRYDEIDDLKFRENYLKSFIISANEWLKLVKTGTELGTYTESGYNGFKKFIDEMLEKTKETIVDREGVIEKRLEYEQKLEEFKATRNTLPINELLAVAKSELNNTPVGVQLGNVSDKTHNELKKMIEAAENDSSDITKLMLERTILDFRASKINLDIAEFKLSEQLEDAMIDNENKTITVKVKYTADMTRVTPTQIGINDNVNISPAINQAINMDGGAVYTVSTKDGSASSEWRINIIRPDVISSETSYSLKEMIADEDNWYSASTTQKYYKEGLFGDITLKFKANISEYLAGDWPSIVFRNQSATEVFSSKNTSCYIIVLSDGKVELHRYNNGIRTQFYGEVADVEQLLGPKLSSNAFKFGNTNNIELTCKNTEDGVRIIFNVNGTEVFNVLDNYPGVITAPGYFGTISPKVQVELSAE